ncbi:hypothetical protein TPA0909_00470 [Streptomyces albus]|nr:hypothetical protein TPA0909_00470 [Streptomyces albus]
MREHQVSAVHPGAAHHAVTGGKEGVELGDGVGNPGIEIDLRDCFLHGAAPNCRFADRY